jgi:ubiquinone/menaquinone biosynthesis C-methylase UbiE
MSDTAQEATFASMRVRVLQGPGTISVVASSIPPRVRWAVDLVDPRPGDAVLEVGGGTAASASLLCARLEEGRLTAIDRSPVAADRIRRGNQEHLDAGRLRVLECDLSALEVPEASIDKAFSLNVNVFWTTSGAAELAVLARVLRTGGLLALLWSGAPTASASSTARVLRTVSQAVGAGPFRNVTNHDARPGCGVVARRT